MLNNNLRGFNIGSTWFKFIVLNVWNSFIIEMSIATRTEQRKIYDNQQPVSECRRNCHFR